MTSVKGISNWANFLFSPAGTRSARLLPGAAAMLLSCSFLAVSVAAAPRGCWPPPATAEVRPTNGRGFREVPPEEHIVKRLLGAVSALEQHRRQEAAIHDEHLPGNH